MKKYFVVLTASVVLFSGIAVDCAAQRGGRGGGGGGARPSVNRSPSMSRPSSPSASRPAIPSRPSAGQLPATRPSTPSRPSAGQLPATRPATPSRPSAGQLPATRPSAPNRPSAGQLPATLPGGAARPSTPSVGTRPSIDRDKIQGGIGAVPGQRPAMPDWFKPGSSQLPSTRPSPPAASQLPTKPGGGDGTQPGRPGAGQPPVAKPPVAGQPPVAKPPIAGQPPVAKPPIAGQPPVARPPIAGQPPGTRPPGVRPPVRPPVVRPPVAGRPIHPWYPAHPSHPNYNPGYWWRWATAGAITGWVTYRWANPIYYRYGSGGNVYYENNVVYIDGQEYGSAEKYYEEATQLAASVPEITDEQEQQMEWMPLGVFALTAEGVNASSMYLQLAVSKEGVIAGTFYNETTGTTHPVEGMVDEETQRAVWKAADGTNADLVMETGIYNLTQDQADVLVHFGPEQTQTVLLVRLDETERPEANEATQ
jgi:hypothetical protein